ncbi:MAG TPA: hypothetical protein DHV48_12885 [Prolixibacteraceae bacterium]|nr:hypothetical protein [Prolixibacteraceae bacterium]
MEKEEVLEIVAAAVNEAMAPLVESAKSLRREDKKPESETKDGPSQSAQDWINDKARGGLGGKALDAPTPHNPNPKKVVDPGPTRVNGNLTGKTV